MLSLLPLLYLYTRGHSLWDAIAHTVAILQAVDHLEAAKRGCSLRGRLRIRCAISESEEPIQGYPSRRAILGAQIERDEQRDVAINTIAAIPPHIPYLRHWPVGAIR